MANTGSWPRLEWSPAAKTDTAVFRSRPDACQSMPRTEARHGQKPATDRSLPWTEACHGRRPATDRSLPRTGACHGPRPTAARCRPRTAACRGQPPAMTSYRPWQVTRGGQMADTGWHSPRPDVRHSWSSATASDSSQPVACHGGCLKRRTTAMIERIVTFRRGSKAKETLILRTYLDIFYG
jgi:hypothetical protein